MIINFFIEGGSRMLARPPLRRNCPSVKGGGKTYHWAEKKCTTEIMAEGADLGVGLATGTVVSRFWEDYAPALAWSGPNLMRSLAESTW